MRRSFLVWTIFCAFLGFTPSLTSLPAYAQTDIAVYSDALGSGWQNWSWGTTLDFAATSPVHSGSKSLSARYDSGYVGLYFSFPSQVDTRYYSALTFYIHGGTTGNQSIDVHGARSGNFQGGVRIGGANIEGGSIVAGAWRKVTLPLTTLSTGGVTDFSGICLQEATGGAQPTFYVDDVVLISIAAPSVVNINVNPSQILRKIDSRTVGVNSAIWDNQFGEAITSSLLTDMGVGALRFPGGSISDEYHWRTNTTLNNTWQWANSFDNFARTARGIGASVYITVNYGSGTPQEAADWVTYSNITQRNGFRYWEIGNENYGSWETDNNTRPHDPYTYAVRAKEYIQRMKAVDPTIKIGLVCMNGEDGWGNYTDHPALNPRTNTAHNGWTPVMLATLKSLGVTPDFLTLHIYPQEPNNESDAGLLQSANWVNAAADLRRMLTDYLGAAGANVEIVSTENNSVSYNPGKQSVSLINALYYCDSLGQFLLSEFNSLVWWGLRNGYVYGTNLNSSLYGWRGYGDYGIVSPTSEKYPTFYGIKLASKFARPGDYVVPATSDYGLLTVYATRQDAGTLKLLVINKSPVSALTGRFLLGDAIPRKTMSVLTYGIPQDEAVRTGVGNPDLATGSQAATRSFTRSFAPYSATVLTIPIYLRQTR